MKDKTKILKIAIDIIMLILMILLMSMNTTGELLHEILGIGIGIAFIIHIILNFKWIKSMTKNIGNKQLNAKSKILYWMNVILGIFMIGDMVTGILISESLFPNINIGDRASLIEWHTWISYWMLIIMAIHLGFHWNMVVTGINKIIKEAKENIFVKIIFKLIYAVIGILGIIGLMKQSINKNFLIPGTVNQNTTKSTYNKEKSNEGRSSTLQTSSFGIVTLSSTQSVNDYLGNLHCTGCGRHCILTNPQCQIGVKQAQTETQNYNNSIANSSTTTNSGSTTTNSGSTTTNASSATTNSGSTTTNASSATTKSSNTTTNSSSTATNSNSSTKSNSATTNSNSSKTNLNSKDSRGFEDYETNGENNFNNKNELNKNQEGTITDYVTIMGFVVGGTYYLLKVTEKKDKK